jgi:transcriptional regulator with XRE-family HTH domain
MIRGRPNPRHQTIAKRLKRLREERKIARSRLALSAGLSNPVVRLIEEGGVPGVDTIERLARVLCVSPGWLAFAPLRAEPAPPSTVEDGAPLLCAGLGARLQGLRDERGLSQSSLAEATGLTRAGIGSIESGRTLPTVASVEQIARGLGVSAAWLAYGEGPQLLPRPLRQRKH